MSRATSRRLAAALLASALPALACLVPSRAFSASGNSRALHATTVPAAACNEYFRGNNVNQNEVGFSSSGSDYFLVDSVPQSGGAAKQVELRCPLSLNGVDLSNPSANNHLSGFRVWYQDTDAGGPTNANIEVTFLEVTISNLQAISREVCIFNTSTSTGTTSPARTIAPCSFDLKFGSLYWFDVFLQVTPDSRQTVKFFGIDFP
jgi:hypothetical protein